MFKKLVEINKKPEPFEFYTAEYLWTNEHTSKKMLEYHLNGSVDLSSRNTDFINKSVSWIVDHFSLNRQSNVLDLGCGPGLYTNRLAEKGMKVTGIDFSNRSINYARKVAETKNLSVCYIHQNYLDHKIKGNYDLITMIMCDFCALSPDQRETMLGKLRDALSPSGKILLDVYSLTAFNKRDEAVTYGFNLLDNFWTPEDHYCFLNTFKYDDEKVILDKYTIIGMEENRVVYNWLQYFNVESLKRELEDNGLIVEEIYADVSGSNFELNSPEIAVVAARSRQ